MEIGWQRPGLQNRQDHEICFRDARAAFVTNPASLRNCSEEDNDCLCSQSTQEDGDEPFYSFLLSRICNFCPNIGPQEPLSFLREVCPDKAELLNGRYTCTPGATQFSELSISATESSTPTPVANLITLSVTRNPFPTATSPSTTQTAQIVNPSSRSSEKPLFAGTASLTGATSLQSSIPSSSLASSTLDAVPAAPARNRSGLSTGAKAGIGVAAGVAAIFILIAAIFFWRRRRNRKGWQAEGSQTPELYYENGTETPYGAQWNVKHISAVSPTPMREKVGRNSHIVQAREISDEDTSTESRVALNMYGTGQNSGRNTPRTIENDVVAGTASNRTSYQQHSRGTPGSKSSSVTAISRKEVPIRNSAAYSTPATSGPPLTHNNHAQSDARSSSRISGTLRGPVPDMYVYGGETITDEAELERLEEEERRIDEAIRESESRQQMRQERDVIRTRIQGLRDSL
ncbi:hypothetical protein B0O99DRAFT_599271 [Bisporella sp. PMI_857]|nr:hypothetical protein B0O99DRAFT_599271 [Bisporella sp. PMI_857]